MGTNKRKLENDSPRGSGSLGIMIQQIEVCCINDRHKEVVASGPILAFVNSFCTERFEFMMGSLNVLHLHLDGAMKGAQSHFRIDFQKVAVRHLAIAEPIAGLISLIKHIDIYFRTQVQSFTENPRTAVHVYSLSDGYYTDLAGDPTAQEQEGSLGQVQLLPHIQYDGVHNSLAIPLSTKDKLLQFLQTSRLFSAAKIDQNCINWNRIALLHGPPGGGKTSLCQAIAQKMAIISGSPCMLVTVNTQNLYSKWFSESGKSVGRLFAQIKQLAVDHNTSVVVIIDEIESISMQRENGKGDPADSLRAVNALLTRIDGLASDPRISILCTSNLLRSIDTAFLDRVDLECHIDHPNGFHRYEILRRGVNELIRKGLIHNEYFMPPVIDVLIHMKQDPWSKECHRLWSILETALRATFSGRFLTKCPMLAFMTAASIRALDVNETIDGLTYIQAMKHMLKQRVSKDQAAENAVHQRVPNAPREP
eukprot:Clim_evm38s144 gene=Clim_evmTU38s144